MFTSVAIETPSINQMIYKVAQRHHLITLLKLLLTGAPRIKFIVIKIMKNLIQADIPFKLFEEVASVLAQESPECREILARFQRVE